MASALKKVSLNGFGNWRKVESGGHQMPLGTVTLRVLRVLLDAFEMVFCMVRAVAEEVMLEKAGAKIGCVACAACAVCAVCVGCAAKKARVK